MSYPLGGSWDESFPILFNCTPITLGGWSGKGWDVKLSKVTNISVQSLVFRLTRMNHDILILLDCTSSTPRVSVRKTNINIKSIVFEVTRMNYGIFLYYVSAALSSLRIVWEEDGM